jgi:NAD(P)-dependent dehydrogenase (short-subunit alcohol dehydrogenase family)
MVYGSGQTGTMANLRVLVTGGSRGVGRAVALRFAREGAVVAVAARNSGQLDEVVKEIDAAGGKGRAAQMNVGDHGSVEAAVWRAVEFTGGALDILVNAAGTFDPKPIAKLDLATWRRHVEVNLDGPYYVVSESLEALSAGNRPHVFNIGANGNARAGAAYGATKAGVRGFSDALREDLVSDGIRVTTVRAASAQTKDEAVAEAIWKAYHASDETTLRDLDVGG